MTTNLTSIAQSFGMNNIQRDIMLGGDILLVFWILGGIVIQAVQ